MPRIWPRLLFCICALLATPAAAQSVGVHWQTDLESAKATAKQTGRLVLVHFWGPECPPCLALDQNVFNQQAVASAIEARFVPVKLNANENAATATSFGITRLPTDVILTPDGQVVGKLISPPTPAAYVAETMQAAAQYASRPGQAFAQAAAQAPMPSQLNSAYAHLQVGDNTSAAAAVANSSAANANSTVARYGQTLPGPQSIGGAAPPISPAGVPTAPQGTFAAWSTGPALPPASASTAPVGGQPVAAKPQSTENPYAIHGAGGMTPSASMVAPPLSPVASVPAAATASAPAQVANQYLMNGSALVSAASTPANFAAPPTGATSNPIQPAAASAATSVGPPDPRALPAGAPPLGFDGYCPVSMRRDWKWVPGDPKIGAIHLGRTYWFAGPSEQQEFLADPHRFSPALSGMDPVLAVDHRQQVPGKREHSIDYDNLFYMFASEATLQQFAANPERYATSVRQAMGIPRGRLVR